MTSDSYFVMHFLGGAPEVGPRVSKDTLHVTFLALVSAPTRYSGDMMLAFYDVTDDIAPFTLGYGESDSYGKDGEFSVIKLVDAQGGAQDLHDSLMTRVRKVRGAEFGNLEYSNENFSSHISFNEMNSAVDGESLYIDHLTLVRHVGGFKSGNVEMVANTKLSD